MVPGIYETKVATEITADDVGRRIYVAHAEGILDGWTKRSVIDYANPYVSPLDPRGSAQTVDVQIRMEAGPQKGQVMDLTVGAMSWIQFLSPPASQLKLEQELKELERGGA